MAIIFTIFLIIKLPNFEYLLVDPGFLSSPLQLSLVWCCYWSFSCYIF